MTAEDAVSHLLMKTFCRSAIQHGRAIWGVLFVSARKKKALFVWVFFVLCAILWQHSACLASCCECSHWAVITHLTAVWNIHGQVSPSLQGSHMDSLLSPPPALIPCHFIPPAFCCTSQLLDTPPTATQCYYTNLWLFDAFETRLSDDLRIWINILCYEFILQVEIQGNPFILILRLQKDLSVSILSKCLAPKYYCIMHYYSYL